MINRIVFTVFNLLFKSAISIQNQTSQIIQTSIKIPSKFLCTSFRTKNSNADSWSSQTQSIVPRYHRAMLSSQTQSIVPRYHRAMLSSQTQSIVPRYHRAMYLTPLNLNPCRWLAVK